MRDAHGLGRGLLPLLPRMGTAPMSDTFWFSAQDDEGPKTHPWKPYLQADFGSPSLAIWFATKDECDAWIRDYVVGAGWEA